MQEKKGEIKLGLKLKELRESKGWSQRHLADLAGEGVSRPDITNVENEKWDTVNPTMKWWKKVCKALDLTYEEFIIKAVTDSFDVVQEQVIKKWIKDKVNNIYELEITFRRLAIPTKSEEK